MTRFAPKASALAAAVAATALLSASGAQAHAHLVKASPAASTTVAAPQSLHLQFSEKLEPKFSKVQLQTAGGASVPATSGVGAKDRKLLDVAPKAPLAAGGYKVLWSVVSADGHKMKGDYSFTVK